MKTIRNLQVKVKVEIFCQYQHRLLLSLPMKPEAKNHSDRSLSIKQHSNSHSTIDGQIYTDDSSTHWEPTWKKPESIFDFQSSLKVCPFCLKTVFQSQTHLLCLDPEGKSYLAHEQCSQEIYPFTQRCEKATKQNNYNVASNIPKIVGALQYFVQLEIKHPLTEKKLFCCSYKMFQNSKAILVQSKSQNESFSFEPNHIVLPLKQFKMKIVISPLFSSDMAKYNKLKFHVDFSQQNNEKQIIKFSSGEFSFTGEFQLVELQKRKRIVDQMNFKYNRPYFHEDFVKLNKFYIQRENLQVTDFDSNSQNLIVESRKNSISTEQKQTSDNSTSILDFIKTLKTQSGSKQFQKKVNSMSFNEIETTIIQILPHLEQIILDEYANYMFQSLLSNCTVEQRMTIIKNVCHIMPRLVCQQQGTFVFQQLISLLTDLQQFQCLCLFAVQNFSTISLDNFGNHFMRKLIQNVPISLLEMFMPQVCKNFGLFSTNKNAVCVMKCVLRALKQGQKKDKSLQVYLRRYIDGLTLNVKLLINDEFGNYLIQQAFDLLQNQRLNGISQFILNSFMKISCDKISSNVVVHCIRSYWKNDYSVFKNLKKHLDNRTISNMYNNRQGNKVLYTLMQMLPNCEVQEKVISVLRNESASKFNNRKWIQLIGQSKTGSVGTSFNNFTEAHEKVSKRRYK